MGHRSVGVSLVLLLAGCSILSAGGCAQENPERPDGPIKQRLRELAECRRFLEGAVDRRVLWSGVLVDLSGVVRAGRDKGDIRLPGIRTSVSEAGDRTLEAVPPAARTSDPAALVSDLEMELAVVALEEVLARDAGLLMDDPEIGLFISVIGEYEKDSGVTIVQLRGLQGRRRETGPVRVETVAVEIRMKATMSQLVRFLERFENHQRLVSVPGITVPERLLIDRGGETRYEARAVLEVLHVPDRDGFPGPSPIPDRGRLRIRPEVDSAVERFPVLIPARRN